MSPDELWAYDITTNAWSQVDDGTGTAPPERSTGKGPAAGGVTHSPLRLYFYGNNAHNDMWYYENLPSSSPSPSPSPSPTPVASPTPASVAGDPVSYFRGKRYEFGLPDGMSLLLKTPDMELWGQPFYGMMGEQWIEKLSVRSKDAEVALVEIRPDIVFLRSQPSFGFFCHHRCDHSRNLLQASPADSEPLQPPAQQRTFLGSKPYLNLYPKPQNPKTATLCLKS